MSYNFLDTERIHLNVFLIVPSEYNLALLEIIFSIFGFVVA